MEVYITNQTDELKWNRYKKKFEEIVLKAKEVLKNEDDFNMSVIFVDSEQIQEINRDYRHKDMPTDVISFALLDEADEYDLEDTMEIGDIFINIDYIYKQSEEYGHTLKREVCFLFTHGLLHLLGYDHMCEEDEKVMFGLQDEILKDIAPRRAKHHA